MSLNPPMDILFVVGCRRVERGVEHARTFLQYLFVSVGRLLCIWGEMERKRTLLISKMLGAVQLYNAKPYIASLGVHLTWRHRWMWFPQYHHGNHQPVFAVSCEGNGTLEKLYFTLFQCSFARCNSQRSVMAET